ncbi:MAG: FHA domain-containing protein [bacterium]|nr:FHA domain-containing protein [bacterium]
MTMTCFLDLLIISGPDKSMRFSIEQGTYRIIGQRVDLSLNNINFDYKKNVSLNPDQQETVNTHLKNYSKNSLMQFYSRGPDILLNDETVSRIHLMVLKDSNMISLVDLASESGTKINEKIIKEAHLKDHDIIIVGNTKIMVLSK